MIPSCFERSLVMWCNPIFIPHLLLTKDVCARTRTFTPAPLSTRKRKLVQIVGKVDAGGRGRVGVIHAMDLHRAQGVRQYA